MKTNIGIMLGSFCAGALLLAIVVVAQQSHPAQPVQPRTLTPPAQPVQPPNPDPLAGVIFPPDLIMGHARQLKLTDEQKTFMRSEIQRTMSTFHELQWKLQDEMESLHEILKSPSVNEEQALAQLSKVLDAEREIKRLHVSLAVRIKNRLTPEQQEQLHKLRASQHVRPAAPFHHVPEQW